MTFKSWLRSNTNLVAGLWERGFEFAGFEESTAEFRPRERSPIYPVLLLSQFDSDTFRCALLVMSEHVAQVFHEQSLWLDAQPTETTQELGVLAIDLLWLRWNGEPASMEQYSDDYQMSGEAGCARFLDDFHALATPFLAAVADDASLASFLANIHEYPVRIKHGGGPRSANPYIYSAILAARSNDMVQVRRVLDKGLARNQCTNPDILYQRRRHENYVARMQKILAMEGRAD